MWHVDEGTLHAYLDDVDRGPAAAALDPGLRTRVAAHLAECDVCASRLQLAERQRARAADILAAASPAIDTPPFESVQPRIAQAGGEPLGKSLWPAAGSVAAGQRGSVPGGVAAGGSGAVPGGVAAGGSGAVPGSEAAGRTGTPGIRPVRRRGAWVPLAWAASLVLAVGAGWMGSMLWRTGQVPGSAAELSPAAPVQPTSAEAQRNDAALQAAAAATPGPGSAARSTPAEPPAIGGQPADAVAQPGSGLDRSAMRAAGAELQAMGGIRAGEAVSEQLAAGVRTGDTRNEQKAAAGVPTVEAAAAQQVAAGNRTGETANQQKVAGGVRTGEVAAAQRAAADSRTGQAALDRAAVTEQFAAAPSRLFQANAALALAESAEAGYPGDADVAWEPVTTEKAQQLLGGTLYLVAGAAVLDIAATPATPRVMVRVRQRMDAGTVELLQWPAAPQPSAAQQPEAQQAEAGAAEARERQRRLALEARAPAAVPVPPTAPNTVRVARDGGSFVLVPATTHPVMLKAAPGMDPVPLLARIRAAR